MNMLMDVHTGPLTMSSREIADLMDKQHAHVCRDIRVMLIELHGKEQLEKIVPEHYRNRHSEYIRENAGSILSAILGDDPKRDHEDFRGFSWERDNRGYVTLFRLDKRHSMILVSGYDVHLRAKIIDRWAELESQQQGIQPPAGLTGVNFAIWVGEAMVQFGHAQVAEQKARELLEVRVSQVEANQEGGDQYMTILGACNALKKSLDREDAIKAGKLAAQMCRESDATPGKVDDRRFGKVNTYPKEIALQAVKAVGSA